MSRSLLIVKVIVNEIIKLLEFLLFSCRNLASVRQKDILPYGMCDRLWSEPTLTQQIPQFSAFFRC